MLTLCGWGCSGRPIFVVSDLHKGDGGPRDNFASMASGTREAEFNSFLDYVEMRHGLLVINGDLFELWQGNISTVITSSKPLIDRLADMGAFYVIGNHDIDLIHFTRKHGIRIDHPLFRNISQECALVVGGRRILCVHGHEQDVYCKSEVPGVGRISAIYTGMREDRNGSPLCKDKWGAATVEQRCLGRWARIGAFGSRLLGHPTASVVMRREIVKTYRERCVDAVIYGHTHEPGQFVRYSEIVEGNLKLPIYNTGTWAETVNTFAEISPTGIVTLFDWVNGTPRQNKIELLVDRS